MNFLILDDDNEVCNLYKTKLYIEGYRVDTANTLDKAVELISSNSYSGILIDVFIDEENSLPALRSLIQMAPASHFFIFSARDSIAIAVQAMEFGAAGFYPKDMGCSKIVKVISSKLRQKKVRVSEGLFEEFAELGLIGNSAAMAKVFDQIHRYSRVDSTVLVTGESGTGKEIVAKALHKLSQRKSSQYQAINCGAIPENLLESELFGHVKGAFTDAKQDKVGLFEICKDGTLMLDEIGDMPFSLQVKLLRVLLCSQKKKFARWGQ